MVLQLPAEVLHQIADFVQSGALSQACRRLWAVLQRRHVTCRVSSATAAAATRYVLGDPAPHTVALVVREEGEALGAAAVDSLAAISRLPSLAGFSLCLRNHKRLADGMLPLLQPLATAPQLQHITLNLWGAEVGPVVAEQIGRLHQTPSLRTLVLVLSWNFLGDLGAEALAHLHTAPLLHHLTMELWRTWLSAAGATSLSKLAQLPRLTSLSLNLRNNRIRDTGAEQLAWALGKARLLHTLNLNLWGCEIEDCGGAALAALGSLPALRTLTLKVSDNQIADQGLLALVALLTHSALRSLTLALAWNRCGDDGACALASATLTPSLRCCALTLSDNRFSPRGIQMLKDWHAELSGCDVAMDL
eukprot:EG_transcript_13151